MNVSKPTHFAGILLILASAACFGSLSILITIATRAGTPLSVLLQWRFTLAALMLAIILRERVRIDHRAALWLFGLGVIAQAAVTYVSLSALEFVDPPTLGFLFFTYPVWLAAFGAMSGRAQLTNRRVLALSLALTGLFVLLRPGGRSSPDWRGVTLALSSAVLYALYLPAISRHQHGIPPLTVAFYVILGAATTFTAAGVATGQLVPPTTSEWGMIALIALVPTVLAFTSMVAGVSALGAVRTSIVGTAEPFFTTVIAASLLGSRMSGATMLGGTLIATAVVVDATARREGSAATS